MIRSLFSLIVMAVIGWVIYASLFGTAEDKARRDNLFQGVKQTFSATKDIFNAEKDKGTFTKTLQSVGKTLEELGSKTKEMGEQGSDYAEKIAELKRKKEELDKLIAATEGTTTNTQKKSTIKEYDQTNNTQKVEDLLKEIETLTNDMSK